VRKFSPPSSSGAAAQNKDDSQKKVLVICYSFPPLNISAVYRPLNFVRFLPDYGWKLFVVTPAKNTEFLDPLLLKEVPQGVAVDEVLSLDPENLAGILNKKNKDGFFGKFKHTGLKVLLKLYSLIYYRLVIVDWYDGWIPFGLLKGLRQWGATQRICYRILIKKNYGQAIGYGL
jgi:hypothetical protein